MEDRAADDEVVLDLVATPPRCRWRARGCIALGAAACIVALLMTLLDPSPDAEVATSSPDPSFSTSEPAADTTAPAPSTTTSEVTTTTIVATTTTDAPPPPAPDVGSPAPVAAESAATSPPIVTTTTTLEPHPWASQWIEFFQAANWDPEVEQLAVNVEGIFDHYVLDFGDGESMVFKSPQPFCNPGYDATAGWTHDYAENGVYTATVTVYGSHDCDTPPALYRASTATITVTVPLVVTP